MAYNLYQVQQSNAWAQRVNKENSTAEKFWNEQANLPLSMPTNMGNMGSIGTRAYTAVSPVGPADFYVPSSGPVDVVYELAPAGSVAGARSHVAKSAAPTGFTSKTGALRNKMEKLEAELSAERESRRKVEADLADLKTSMTRR
ncbi:hypothetical protein TSOC_009333, partial [Tetrabaena socialis]